MGLPYSQSSTLHSGFVPSPFSPASYDLHPTQIHDLNNVPLGVGTSHVKWHLPSSTSAEHRGRTDKVHIRDHKATYDYTKQLPVRLTVDKSRMLEECSIHFEVVQDYSEGTKSRRVMLGNIKLNLSEYVDRPDELKRNPEASDDDGEAGITRRYLMHDSKVNSTLKVGILMRQTEGEANFIVPPLKTATVFGGIAGIVAAEATDANSIDRDGGDAIPTITSKTRELSEAQDIYRRTLAATWACQSGELPPDRLVEDLFAGGDGGAMKPPPHIRTGGWHTKREGDREDTGSMSEAESRRTVRPSFLSPGTARDGNDNGSGNGNSNGRQEQARSHRRHGTRSGSDGALFTRNGSGDTAVSGRGSIEGQMPESINGHRRREHKDYREVTEFDIRPDLRSWKIMDESTLGGRMGSKHESAHINRANLEIRGT